MTDAARQPATLPPPDIHDALEELKLERGYRRRVYPRFVELKKMRQVAADRRMACLDKAIDVLAFLDRHAPAFRAFLATIDPATVRRATVKMTIESTDQFVPLPAHHAMHRARVWVGKTEAGADVLVWVVLVGAKIDQPVGELERDLIPVYARWTFGETRQ